MLERVCRQRQEAEERETGEGSDSGTPRWVPRWLNLPSPRQKSPTAQLGAEQQPHAASLSPRRPSLSPHRVPRGPTAPMPSSLPSLPSSRPSRRALPTELSPQPPSLLGWVPKAWRLSSALNLRAATRASYRMLIRILSARSERTLQHAMRRASSIRSSTRSPRLARGVSHTWAARMHMTEPARWDPRAAAAQVAMEMESRAAATRAQVAMQQSQQHSARRMRRGASSSRH